MTLAEIIAKLEAATKGSLELDLAIASRRLRREIGAILPVLFQGAFMAGAAVALLLCWTRWAAGGLFQ